MWVPSQNIEQKGAKCTKPGDAPPVFWVTHWHYRVLFLYIISLMTALFASLTANVFIMVEWVVSVLVYSASSATGWLCTTHHKGHAMLHLLAVKQIFMALDLTLTSRLILWCGRLVHCAIMTVSWCACSPEQEIGFHLGSLFEVKIVVYLEKPTAIPKITQPVLINFHFHFSSITYNCKGASNYIIIHYHV